MVISARLKYFADGEYWLRRKGRTKAGMKIVIFGGTAEGRRLVEAAPCGDLELHICVATEYGTRLLPERQNVIIHQGTMEENEMEAFLSETAPSYCLDATHPYADLVTKNVQKACLKLKIPYIRVWRKEENAGDFISVESVAAAAEFLKGVSGNIFLTTGSKELDRYTMIPDYRTRCFARVLPSVEVIKKCDALGFFGKNLIAMQGPFSEEINYAMLRQTKSEWMVTKNSGREGGYQEKCEAAIRAGVKIVVVERPREVKKESSVMSLSEALQFLTSLDPSAARKELPVKEQKRKVILVGAGPGNPEYLTKKAMDAIRDSDVLIGAERMLEVGAALLEGEGKPSFSSCRKEEIAAFLREHREYQKAAILYSGDIGFYSGAKGMGDLLDEFEIEEVSGVSSVVYFLNRLGVPWNETTLISLHGKQENLLPLIREKKWVCALLGERGQISYISQKLLQVGLIEVKITVGERLSYPEERIASGKPSFFEKQEFEALSVALFENPNPVKRSVWAGISDEEFLRGRVPMTKEEIRTLSLSKLHLTEDAVIYDVGAGTGSFSVEAARLCRAGMVYAIERKSEAAELIRQNKVHFQVENLKVVEGSAPECLTGLPAPTHVFIGGSGRRMPEIIGEIRKKNPNARFVINAVTLETIAEIEALKKKLPDLPEIEIIQVNVARSRRLGEYHLMDAENPVMIAAF